MGPGTLVGPFKSHESRSPFKGLTLFLQPVGEQSFIVNKKDYIILIGDMNARVGNNSH